MKNNISYKEASDKHRRYQVFKIGDQVMVYLCKEGLSTWIQGKLRQRWYGPFHVLKKINDNGYAIDLPDDTSISKTFNVPWCTGNFSLSSWNCPLTWRWVLFKRRIMMRDVNLIMWSNCLTHSPWLQRSLRGSACSMRAMTIKVVGGFYRQGHVSTKPARKDHADWRDTSLKRGVELRWELVPLPF